MDFGGNGAYTFYKPTNTGAEMCVVLEPLAEIVPKHRHHEFDLTYAGMWRHFPGQRDQTRISFDFD